MAQLKDKIFKFFWGKIKANFLCHLFVFCVVQMLFKPRETARRRKAYGLLTINTSGHHLLFSQPP